jgi:hypothetical protein
MSDHTHIRARAASYAKSFLANKYHEEYAELYRAYLTNRGVPIRTSTVVDERELSRTDSVQSGEK